MSEEQNNIELIELRHALRTEIDRLRQILVDFGVIQEPKDSESNSSVVEEEATTDSR